MHHNNMRTEIHHSYKIILILLSSWWFLILIQLRLLHPHLFSIPSLSGITNHDNYIIPTDLERRQPIAFKDGSKGKIAKVQEKVKHARFVLVPWLFLFF